MGASSEEHFSPQQDEPVIGMSGADFAPSPQGYPATQNLPAAAYLLKPGTVDLRNRQITSNPEGTAVSDPRYYGSEFSARDDLPDGSIMSYPTIYEGKNHNRQEAYKHAIDTGQHLGIFRKGTPDKYLDEYENKLHSRQITVNGKVLNGDSWSQMRRGQK